MIFQKEFPLLEMTAEEGMASNLSIDLQTKSLDENVLAKTMFEVKRMRSR